VANAKRNLDKLIKQASKYGPEFLSPEQQFLRTANHLIYANYPTLWCKEAIGFDPDPWQAEFIDAQDEQVICCTARQSGKTTATAAKVLHHVLHRPKATVLLVAPAIPQATEFRLRLEEHMRVLQVKPETSADNKRELKFDNGSRIVIIAADKDTVRGYTPTMIVEDEARGISEEVHEALKGSLLVSRGQFIMLSTPGGMRGNFAEVWHNQPDWRKFKASIWENPRVKDPEKRRKSYEDGGRLWWFQQEYECSFIASAQGLVYPFDPKKNVAQQMARPESEGWQYVLGIDYGFTDATAYVVLGWRRDDPHVYVIESLERTKLLAAEAAEIANTFSKKYPFARMVGDISARGYVEEARRRFRLPLEAAEKHNKRGYLDLMASDLRSGFIKVCPGNDALTDEWKQIPWDEEREMPMDGYKDHLSDACLYAWRATCHYLEQARQPGPKPGTPEALAAEAEEMLQERIREVTKPQNDWWEEGDAQWLVQDESPVWN
jgi:hypothetical protein